MQETLSDKPFADYTDRIEQMHRINQWNNTKCSQGSDGLQLVSFSISQKRFAFDILRVREIIRMVSLDKAPRYPSCPETVIHLRGSTIPVFELRERLGYPKGVHTEQTRVVVVEVRSQSVGFVVDSVHDVIHVESRMFEQNPSNGVDIDSDSFAGIAKHDGQQLILLEPDNLLSSDSLSRISDISNAA